MNPKTTFNAEQLETIRNAVAMAEELVSNAYKMSASQWLRRKYDIKTLAELSAAEIVDGPFAQIIRYEGHQKDRLLGSASYDLYKICLQDHAVLATLAQEPKLSLFPFSLYIIAHELIHVIRFSEFLQNFNASTEERAAEERRVHDKTHEILTDLPIPGLPEVLAYYAEWRTPFEGLAQR
jgi:hypothetical protein